MNEDRVLVRAHVAIAGGPPRGEIDWVSRELYEAAAKSGKLESVENLSSRLRAAASEVTVEVARLGLTPVTDEPKDAPADGILKEPIEVPADGTEVTLKADPHIFEESFGGLTRVDPDHPSVP